MSELPRSSASDINVYGIDFTSRPSCDKPIVAVECHLDGNLLRYVRTEIWESFERVEDFLKSQPYDSPWIAGIDAPFGLATKFVKEKGWATEWSRYVRCHVKPLSEKGWIKTLERYKKSRKKGDKEHFRTTDRIAGSNSPQHLANPPVGTMFYHCAPMLMKSGVKIPGLHEVGSPDRVVVEAYPGVAAHQLVGKLKYKTEQPSKRNAAQKKARILIKQELTDGKAFKIYGIGVKNCGKLSGLIEDCKGDHLDALLCCLQAAWAWRNPVDFRTLPASIGLTEGLIADPLCSPAALWTLH